MWFAVRKIPYKINKINATKKIACIFLIKNASCVYYMNEGEEIIMKSLGSHFIGVGNLWIEKALIISKIHLFLSVQFMGINFNMYTSCTEFTKCKKRIGFPVKMAVEPPMADTD